MLLCPEQAHTSPKRTFTRVCLGWLSPALKTLSVYDTGAPPVVFAASVAGSTARHVLALVLYGRTSVEIAAIAPDAGASCTVTSPCSAVSVKPHTTARCGARCSTMCDP